MMFRTKFLCLWIIFNLTEVFIIEKIGSIKKDVLNDGTIGFVEVFAIYMTALYVYKVMFGTIHILNFKFKMNCLRKYKF